MDIFGTTGNDDLPGTSDADTITGREGDDSLNGGAGLDTYIFDPGFGTDVITETGGANGGIIRFGAGITLQDVRFERWSSDRADLLIIVGADSIRVRDFYNSTSTNASNSQLIQQLEFADGTTLDMTGAVPFRGTSVADTFTGTTLGDLLAGRDA